MMGTIVSYAQNGEDVVLARALSGVSDGVYLDIGANDPELYSVSKSFYDRGWSGLCVEPNPAFVQRFRHERPRDQVLQAVISDSAEETLTLYVIPDSGLSTLVGEVADGHATRGFEVEPLTVPSVTLVDAVRDAGLLDTDIHFAVIDTEGAELTVLRSADFTRIRPWILVIEATAPLSTRKVHESWEPIVLDAGYVFCLFDGLSRFYVDARHHPELVDATSYPAGVFDDFTTIEATHLAARLDGAERAVTTSAAQLAELRHSRSWLVTAPLRAVGRAVRRPPRRPSPPDASPTPMVD